MNVRRAAIHALCATGLLAALMVLLLVAFVLASFLVAHGLAWIALLEAFVLIFGLLFGAAYLYD